VADGEHGPDIHRLLVQSLLLEGFGFPLLAALVLLVMLLRLAVYGLEQLCNGLGSGLCIGWDSGRGDGQGELMRI
jgi:hypothetical protein